MTNPGFRLFCAALPLALALAALDLPHTTAHGQQGGLAPASGPAVSANAAASQAAIPPEIDKAMQLPDGKEKLEALGAAIKAWAQKDPTAGLAWMLALPPAVYGPLRPNVGTFVKGADPKRSADWLVQDGSARALDMLHLVATGWAQADSPSAQAWCVKLESKDGKTRAVAFFSVADGLCRKKPELAAAWVAQLPVGEDRLSAVEGAALLWGRGDIVAATAWIKTLGPAELKRAAQRVVGAWNSMKGTKTSPNEWHTAQEWLEQMPLAAADRDYVLKNPIH